MSWVVTCLQVSSGKVLAHTLSSRIWYVPQVSFSKSSNVKNKSHQWLIHHVSLVSWSRQIFITGLSRQLVLVLILAWQTSPLPSWTASTTFPMFQELCRIIYNEHSVSSNKIALDFVTFLRLLKLWHVFPNPSFPKQIGDVLYLFPSMYNIQVLLLENTDWKRWLTSRSLGSVDGFVIGLLFRIASTSHNTVWRPSSSRVWTLIVELRTFLIERINLSQAPRDGSHLED